jgi:hypothetical protein
MKKQRDRLKHRKNRRERERIKGDEESENGTKTRKMKIVKGEKEK